MTTSLTPLQQSLRQWIKDQLPSIPQPKLETLKLLTQGQAAEELFDFLTTRVRTTEETATIRALLSLQDPNNEPIVEHINRERSHDDEVANILTLKTQVAEAEQRLSRLQNLVSEKCGQKYVSENEGNVETGVFGINGATSVESAKTAGRIALTESVQAARVAVDNANIALRTLCGAASIEPTNTTLQLRTAIETTASNALNDPPNADELELDIESLTLSNDSSAVAASVLEALRDSVRLRAASGVLESNTNLETGMTGNFGMSAVVQSVRDTIQDAQLRAGSAWRSQCLTVETTEKRIKEYHGELTGRVGEIRNCVAELEAERAVLAFATEIRDNILDDDDMENECNIAPNDENENENEKHNEEDTNNERYISDLRTQREASLALAEQRLRDLQMAAAQLATGSASQLAKVRASALSTTQNASRVSNDVIRAVRAGRRQAGAVEHALRAIEIYPDKIHNFRDSQHDSEELQSTAAKTSSIQEDPECDANNVMDKDDEKKHLRNPSQWDVIRGWEAVRKEDMELWSSECSRIARGLSTRADVAAENRKRALRRVDENIAETVTEALSAAQECREREAVLVQQEMRNWATEPGRRAIRWLPNLNE